jgi:hypothetical protein
MGLDREGLAPPRNVAGFIPGASTNRRKGQGGRLRGVLPVADWKKSRPEPPSFGFTNGIHPEADPTAGAGSLPDPSRVG